MDTLDRAARSRVMRSNRSSGTKSTEWKFRSLLIRSGIRGWKMGHRSGLPGGPDFVFPRSRVAVFVDGCFWHGCRRCRAIPASNRAFWSAKIAANKKRDRRANRLLGAQGWRAVRYWEHELRDDPAEALVRLGVFVKGKR